MGFTLAEAYVELSTKGFSGVMSGIASIHRQLITLEKPTSSASAGISMLAGGIAGLASAGITAGISAVTNAIEKLSEAIVDTVETAANFEAIEVQLTTLTGNVNLAKKLVADLQTFAAQTPLEFMGLSKTTKELMAFGVAQDQILPTLQVLGDAAAATGQSINEIGHIYGKVKGTGKLTWETLNQFQERAIPLVATLAKQFNATEAAIWEMVRDGKVGFGDVQQALLSMSSAGGVFADGMTRQSRTLLGLWSTFSDSISVTMARVGNAIIDGFDLRQAIESAGSLVDMFGNQVVPMIADGIQSIRGYLASLEPYLSGVADFFWAVGEVGSQAFHYITVGAQFFLDAYRTILNSLIGPTLSTLADVIRNFDQYFTIIGLIAANQFLNAVESVRLFGTNALIIGNWAVENWQTIFLDMANLAVTAFANIGSNLRMLWDAVLDYISGNGFQVNFTPLTEGFKSAIKEMPELAKGNFNRLEKQIDRAYLELAERQDDRENELTERRNQPQQKPKTPQNFAESFNVDGKRKGEEGKRSEFAFVGLAQLAEKMQTAAAKESMDREMLAATKESATDIKVIRQALDNGAMKVSQVTFPSPEPVNFAFGG